MKNHAVARTERVVKSNESAFGREQAKVKPVNLQRSSHMNEKLTHFRRYQVLVPGV